MQWIHRWHANEAGSYKEFYICSLRRRVMRRIFHLTLENALHRHVAIFIFRKVARSCLISSLCVLLFPYITGAVYDERQRKMQPAFLQRIRCSDSPSTPFCYSKLPFHEYMQYFLSHQELANLSKQQLYHPYFCFWKSYRHTDARDKIVSSLIPLRRIESELALCLSVEEFAVLKKFLFSSGMNIVILYLSFEKFCGVKDLVLKIDGSSSYCIINRFSSVFSF